MNDSSSIPSPCIGVCFIDPDQARCVGCARTLEEIQLWRALSDAERVAVLEAIERRRADESP
jgi:predicted Fe-S protein YdhL (DUF1289 family)